MPQIEQIFRYPVKGLPAQSCQTATLDPQRGLVGDRIYALSKASDTFYESWAKKSYFLQWMGQPKLARLTCLFQDEDQFFSLKDGERLLFEGQLDKPDNTDRLAQAVQSFLALDQKPLLHHAQKGSFTDQDETVISLGQSASLAALNAEIGEPADMFMARFRLNIWLKEGQPFEELDWVGRRAKLGSAVLYFTEPVGRCQAVNASPSTGLKRQDENQSDLTKLLRDRYDHDCLGIFARIEKAGHFSVNDQLIFM